MINPEAYQTESKEFTRDDYGHIRPVIAEKNQLAKEVVPISPDIKLENIRYDKFSIADVMKEAERYRDNVARVIGYKKKFSWEK